MSQLSGSLGWRSMRLHVPCALSVVFLVSGCFAPKLDPGAPAPNYNPAAQRDDYPEPKGSASRSHSAGDDRRALPRGSGKILKDFERLTPERIRKAYEENDAWQRNDGSQEASEADGASPPETPE